MSFPRHDFTEAALAACIGKHQHHSWSDARRAAKRMRKKHHVPFAAYRCTFCGLIHVGEDIL